MNLNIFFELPKVLKAEINNSISEDNIQNLFQIILNILEEAGDLKPKFQNKEVNLFFIEDLEIKKLNQDFRNKNKTTDCLSFPSFEEEDFLPIFGEIFIAMPYIQKQAEKYGVTLDSEISKMIIHSILHIFSYDHIKEEDFKKMNLLEEKIMGAWKII